jgi:hypothetical protein
MDIGYINPNVCAPEISPYEGESYEELVPDTPDVQERIALAVGGLTGPTDPEADHELYFWADFFANPPMLYHSFDDWCQPKLMEALPLLRTASGSAAASGVDESWRRSLVRSIGPDGLSYSPPVGRSWSRLDGAGLEMTMPVFRADGTITTLADRSVTQVSPR